MHNGCTTYVALQDTLHDFLFHVGVLGAKKKKSKITFFRLNISMLSGCNKVATWSQNSIHF
jgi:hypothetical protein